jgi:predicted transcriptional regulator
MRHQHKNSLVIFKSKYFLPILSKIQQGYRPTLIAEQLSISPQLVNYYTDNLTSLDLIEKSGDRRGIAWSLTEKGKLILKEVIRRSVNSFNNGIKDFPVRLHNVCIAFRIHSPIPENDRLHWTKMKNGVSKCTIDRNEHTVELIKSEKQGEKGSSIMLIHLSEQYCFNWTETLIRLSYVALDYARQASIQFRIGISNHGYPVKKPHIAFEYDMIALFLAISHTSEINTNEEGKAWIDSSTGIGELETNDPGYAYDYLMMPKYVREILGMITIIKNQTLGYERHYHFLTTNN